jgi:hypothetical protein
MKKRILTIISGFYTCIVFSQTPVVYINIVSHNEPGDNLQTPLKFNAMNTKVLQLAAIVDSKGAKWNLETCDGYPTGAFNLQTINSNIFRTLTTAPYADNIEIDPRPKVVDTTTMNIADTYRLLDTLGCNPTTTLGGFVYATSNQSVAPIDWFKFQNTIIGKKYPWKTWKANLMWGAGSYQPHTNDLNDYGIWKPDTVSYSATQTNFYNHNANRAVWFIGNGCQPIFALDSTENEQKIITTIKNFVSEVQTGAVPQNKFYVLSVVINQSHFGPTLFQKVTNVIDSVNSWGANKIQWKKLTEKFSTFQTWQNTSGLQYSQWLCGQTVGIEETYAEGGFNVYPNPTNEIFAIKFKDKNQHTVQIYDMIGNLILSNQVTDSWLYEMSKYSNGLYLVKVDNVISKKLIKQ